MVKTLINEIGSDLDFQSINEKIKLLENVFSKHKIFSDNKYKEWDSIEVREIQQGPVDMDFVGLPILMKYVEDFQAEFILNGELEVPEFPDI